MMNLLTYLAVGVAMGWLASLLLRTTDWPSLGLNLLAGMAGASVAAWLAPPLVGAPPLAQGVFSLEAASVAVLGAMFVLALLGAARRHPLD